MDLLDELFHKAGGYDDYVYVVLVMRFQETAGAGFAASVASVDEFLRTKKIAPPTRKSLLRIGIETAIAVLARMLAFSAALALGGTSIYLYLSHPWSAAEGHIARLIPHLLFLVPILAASQSGLLAGYSSSPRNRITGHVRVLKYALTALSIAFHSRKPL